MAKRHDGKAARNLTGSKSPNSQELHEEIEQLAYQLFCQCGYEHGHDLEHWAEAERQVLGRHQGKGLKGG